MPKKRAPQGRTLSVLTARLQYLVLLLVFVSLCLIALFFLKTKEVAYNFAFIEQMPPASKTATQAPEAFPIGVDPSRALVIENPDVDSFISEHYSFETNKRGPNWLTKSLAFLTQFSWYQNLASPISRILVVDSGERKEEVLSNFAKILRWDEREKALFADLVTSSAPQLVDGKFFPGHYVLDKDATPEQAARMLTEQFNTQVLARYPQEIDSLVPIEDALTIASLLEREAYSFEDMRHISGVIWNRLFIDMPLQLDATLQYANANTGTASWWPPAKPQDKFIDSPFNTYQNKGLPPSPIANPSIAALIATLNPKKTECIFYFHDRDGGFHCTETYEEHVALLKEYYGAGR